MIIKRQSVYAAATLALVCLSLLYSCSKSSSNQLGTAATDINLQFEQKYIVSLGSPAGPYALPYADTIVFHSNNTITESSGSQSATYNVAYIPELSALASVYSNGAALVVALSSKSILNNGFPVFNGALGNDTASIATYETGTIATNGKPTLGCQIFTGYSGTLADYTYLWFIKE